MYHKNSMLAVMLAFTFLPLSAIDPLVFPKDFVKGVALSSYQNGGHHNNLVKSNWSEFEKQHIYFNAKTINGPAINHGETIGKAAGFWDHAIDDIELIKSLGCDSFRFSIEWADVEPEKGKFDEAVLDFYERLIDQLLANNIKPMVTLHHFVHPQWFEDMGGFLKEKNTHYFLRYCKKVFARLGTKVPFWCTINEPTVLGACGYILGIHPPSKLGKFSSAGKVLQNLLNAHVAVYKTLKAMPGGQEAQIGIVHQMLTFEPYLYRVRHGLFEGAYNDPVSKLSAKIFNFSFAHNITKEFLKTGKFEYRIPLIGWVPVPGMGKLNISSYNPDAPDSYDFIGLNFYSKVILGPGPTCYPGQRMTDMEYAMRPKLLYYALKEMADLGKPIYITENGLADNDDSLRTLFIRQYLRAVHQAVEEGVDVRGYYFWTLMDNFEWNDGFDMKFGLYETDYTTLTRTLKKGGATYRDFFVKASS